LPVRPQEIDADGWPVGEGDAPVDERHARAKERLRLGHERQLRVCEQAVREDRYFPAAMDAFRLCLDRMLPLPEWLGNELWAILVKVYAKPRNSKRYEAETRRREKHMRRWKLVSELLERREELDQTRDSAPQTTAEYLEDTPALGDKGGREAVWKSFTKVERGLKGGQAGKVYCAEFRVPSPQRGVRNPAKKG